MCDFKRSQYSNTSALKWQEKKKLQCSWTFPAAAMVSVLCCVRQTSLPAEAPLQILLPVQQITGLGDGHFFSGSHVWSWLALLQPVGLAGAMCMWQPDEGSGSVGSRSHISHTDLVEKALLWQNSSIFGEV